MPLKKGDKAPDFTLFDTAKSQRTLKEFLGRKTVLVFFPGAFTGVCTKEMCAVRDSLSVLASANAQVVAISVDSPLSNKAFAEQNRLPFPILSDYTRTVSSAYCGLYPNFSQLPGYTASKRSVFILDGAGTVQYAWISDDPAIEPDYDAVKSAVNAMR